MASEKDATAHWICVEMEGCDQTVGFSMEYVRSVNRAKGVREDSQPRVACGYLCAKILIVVPGMALRADRYF